MKRDAEQRQGPSPARRRARTEPRSPRSPAQDEHPVFGKPLRESLRYASVQISTANANGELYVWGCIPVVVAKCGLYLKENATEVPGTFRVNGSNKRMRELQQAFETPPRYGKDLDWKQETYTTHDVASVFRRYLTQMPEPVIPYDLYHEFRDALAKQPNTHEQVVTTYKRLLRQMPPPNQYLLLYVLDLLSVFARKSDKNLMTAENLAVIFRPGIISHPSHELSPNEHRLSQKVLEFLIAHQELFIFDIPPPPGTPGSPIDEDFVAVPSSDDEQSQVGGGWRLVGRNRSQRVARRKTIDRTGKRSL
ncbi:Rho GTPase activation protein [Schizophyllum commune Loenen D]|nr:Rho GTPase activation protein [Schizophyllum commune Loenen D]